MHMRHVRLMDFRSWPLLELDLEPGVTTFIGRNGHGKTNILESLQVLATLSSHRVGQDAPMLRTGVDTSLISGLAHNAGRELTVELALNRGKPNRARLNTSPCRRVADILGVVQSVLFAPEDLGLVRGDPGERRRFLDDLMVQRRPVLAGVRSDYQAVLRQRTALLKSAGPRLRPRRGGPSGSDPDTESALSTLDVWDTRLAGLGAQIVAGRVALVREIRPHVHGAYSTLAPESRPADLEYQFRTHGEQLSEDDLVEPEIVEAAFLSELARRRTEEIDRGASLVGPHRDELSLTLGDEPAKGFASHGETWSVALALRLASLELMRSDGLEPVLMLDDVFAELDRSRRRALAGVATGVEQVLVTAAVADDVPAELRGTRHDINMVGEGRQRQSVLAGSSAFGDEGERS